MLQSIDITFLSMCLIFGALFFPTFFMRLGLSLPLLRSLQPLGEMMLENARPGAFDCFYGLICVFDDIGQRTLFPLTRHYMCCLRSISWHMLTIIPSL